MEKILIIGGVAAGATAAAKARRLSTSAQITILESGPDISFANCGLPYFIGGDIKNRSSLILQSPESFKDQYNVTVYTHTLAEGIDINRKIVKARNSLSGESQEFEYTKLILAQGGRPITPNLPGSDLEHVFTLWTLEDMDRIDKFIKEKDPKAAVIAGGGFIGLEMAEALVKRGLIVHVVEKLPHVMSLMDAEISGFVEEELASYGVQLHTNAGVAKIQSEKVQLDDGSFIDGQIVLLSIGVRPTLQLARDAGLAIGDAGGLLVNELLQTSDPSIFAAGDMVEIEHRVHRGKVRIPLAGPANRQGRIAAENALGFSHKYHGSLGTSIVRVFDAVAGITGLSLKAARNQGIDADAVTVHKEHHTSYYPGAKQVTVRLVYERKTGRVLGGQTAGYAGADRRLDVLAMAAFSGMTIHELAGLDFAYSPPLGTANDAINMASFVAENRESQYSPSLTVEELDLFVKEHKPLVIDVRDSFAFEKSHIIGANNIPLEFLKDQLAEIPSERTLLIYDETGKKGHQALRMILGARQGEVVNVTGGHTSMQRYARAVGFSQFKLPVISATRISLEKEASSEIDHTNVPISLDQIGPIIVDVRTPEEFANGAYPNAINIPLDDLQTRIDELGSFDREITLYCASGARSGYAMNILKQLGFTNLKNGGGLMHMMRRNA